MITFIIIGSVVLHGISLLAIIILYLRQNQYKQSEQTLYKMKVELEETIQAYLMEMKEENQAIVATLELLRDDEIGALNNLESDKSIQKEIKRNTAPKPSLQTASNATSKQSQHNLYEPPYASVHDTVELTHSTVENPTQAISFSQALSKQINKYKKNVSEEERAFQMREEGLSVEEIAKQLHKGKTEVDLLLKFHSKTRE